MEDPPPSVAHGVCHDVRRGSSGKRIKIPFGALGPAQLATIAEAFCETDWHRITPEFIVVDCLKPALDAENIAYLFYQGRLVDSFQTQDWDTRLKAVNTALKVHKAFPDEYDNIHSATHRDIALLVSAARQKEKQIQIVRQSQILYIR